MREFAKIHLEQLGEREKAIEAGELSPDDWEATELPLPVIPYVCPQGQICEISPNLNSRHSVPM